MTSQTAVRDGRTTATRSSDVERPGVRSHGSRSRHLIDRGGGPVVITLVATLAILGLAIVVGPSLWAYTATGQDPRAALQGPSWDHPAGTDRFGRDLLARVLEGGRWTLGGALLVALTTNLIGLIVGVLLSLAQGTIGTLSTRLIEGLMALPPLLLALGLTAAFGPSYTTLLIAIVLSSWPWYARVYRDDITHARLRPHVDAANCCGASGRRIALVHIRPLLTGRILLLTTTNLVGAMLQLAAFSFIGLGIQPPTPEWGVMVAEGRLLMQRDPWQLVPPGLALLLVAVLVQSLGDALRDRSDPFQVNNR